MSNADVVNRLYAGFAAGDIDAVVATFADDIEWTEAAGYPYAGTFVGAEAIVDNVFRRLGTEWDGYKAEPDRVISDGDQAAARGWYSGTCKQTGKSFRPASCTGTQSPTARSPASSRWSTAAKSTKPSNSCRLRPDPSAPQPATGIGYASTATAWPLRGR
jgi:ketosteroid isomerase-like protein